ncbi:hypothetical protein CDD81_8004 [Ophiocordyceps australis]|uniref:Uncharacterized protein n=1 Tax=Ophiocordyceps australis TaxID=1399860 RepID=A0A2C5XZ84_9HYPO|nr:hypothetical protein CDD81_8004 [Ophiocordyceps australis]
MLDIWTQYTFTLMSFAEKMASQTRAAWLLVLIVLCSSSAAAGPSLPEEVSRFVPACAQGCFASFVLFNYGGRAGGVASLEGLCGLRGDSEFTLGEGAVQCLVASRSVASCSEDEASAAMIYRAREMCRGVRDALEPTHRVITATLVLPPSGGGAVSFPGRSSTSAPTWTTRAPRTTSRRAFNSSSTASSSSVAVASKPTRSSSTTAPAASTQPPSVQEAAPSQGLSAGQKAGISIGVMAFAGLVIGLVALALLYRRRKRRCSQPLPSSESLPRRETWGYTFGNGSSSSGNSNSNNNTRHEPPPRAYSRASWRPSAIGLAISPTYSRLTATPPPRRLSKLLPPRPELPPQPRGAAARVKAAMPNNSSTLSTSHTKSSTLSTSHTKSSSAKPATRSSSIPTSNGDTLTSNKSSATLGTKTTTTTTTPPKLDIPRPDALRTLAGLARDSTMTEFEEDDNGQQPSPEGQIWRAPSMLAYYVADSHGNWVLADARRQSHVAQVDVVTPVSASSPASPAPHTSIANALRLPVAHRAQKVDSRSPRLPLSSDDAGTSYSNSNSNYSNSNYTTSNSNTNYSNYNTSNYSNYSNSNNAVPAPKPLFSSTPNPRHSRPLSPVAESPATASQRIRNASAPPPPPPPPPSRPLLYFPPGQPSPTLGTYQRVLAPHRGPGLPASPTVRLVDKSPEPEAPGHQEAEEEEQRLAQEEQRLAQEAQRLAQEQEEEDEEEEEDILDNDRCLLPSARSRTTLPTDPPLPQHPSARRRPPPTWTPGLPAHPRPLPHYPQPVQHPQMHYHQPYPEYQQHHHHPDDQQQQLLLLPENHLVAHLPVPTHHPPWSPIYPDPQPLLRVRHPVPDAYYYYPPPPMQNQHHHQHHHRRRPAATHAPQPSSPPMPPQRSSRRRPASSTSLLEPRLSRTFS